jgi:hypothetical protein
MKDLDEISAIIIAIHAMQSYEKERKRVELYQIIAMLSIVLTIGLLIYLRLFFVCPIPRIVV